MIKINGDIYEKHIGSQRVNILHCNGIWLKSHSQFGWIKNCFSSTVHHGQQSTVYTVVKACVYLVYSAYQNILE
jgi:hypothetical protein